MINAEIKSTPEINIWHDNLSVSTHNFMPLILVRREEDNACLNYSDPVLKVLWTMALPNKFLSTSQQVKFFH